MLLNVFNNSNFVSCTVRSQAVHINAVCLCDGRQEVFLTGEVVNRQGSLARGQVLAVVHCHFCREFPFDGGSPLELVINLHAQAPACFFELCGDIGRPFSCMSSELPYLRNIIIEGEGGGGRGREREREWKTGIILSYTFKSVCMHMQTHAKAPKEQIQCAQRLIKSNCPLAQAFCILNIPFEKSVITLFQ